MNNDQRIFFLIVTERSLPFRNFVNILIAFGVDIFLFPQVQPSTCG